jgi:hypothetical protein
VPIDTNAPWRDGPQVYDVEISQPGGGSAVRLSANGVDANWVVQGRSGLSVELTTGDLLIAFGTTDIRGKWITWEHPTLPAWAGEISEAAPDGASGTTEIGAQDYSALLSARRIAKVYTVRGGPAGAMVRRVLDDHGREAGGYTWVTPYIIEEAGDPITVQLRGIKVDEAIRTISERSGHEWWVDDLRRLWWLLRRGRDRTGTMQLVENRHVLNPRPTFSLPPVVNDLLGVPADATYARTRALVRDDDASIRQLGRRQDQLTYDGYVTEASLRPLVERDLKRLTGRGRAITFDLVNVDGCFTWFEPGDSIYVLYPSINWRMRIRVMVLSYSSASGLLTVSGTVEA